MSATGWIHFIAAAALTICSALLWLGFDSHDMATPTVIGVGACLFIAICELRQRGRS